MAFNGADAVKVVPFAFPEIISTWATSPFNASVSIITFSWFSSNSHFVNNKSVPE